MEPQAPRESTDTAHKDIIEGDLADELLIYEELHSYLSANSYPVGCSKAEKAVIRKRAKKFELADGVLHYRDENKSRCARTGQAFLRQVRSLHVLLIKNRMISFMYFTSLEYVF